MLERDFKRKIQNLVTFDGWIILQLHPSSGIPEGFPDTLLIAPNGYSCHVEWKKSKDAKRRPLQPYWVDRLNNMKHDAFFIYPENAEEYLEYVEGRNKGYKPVSLPRGLLEATR